MKKILTIFLACFVFFGVVQGQEHAIIDKYNSQKEVTASGSITFKHGFEVQAGANFSAYISPAVNGAVQNLQKPHSSHNYVVTYNVRQAGISNPFDTTNLNSHVNVAIDYADSWGRPVGTVDVKGSPSLSSILALREYDDMGREIKKYLPYTKSGHNGYYLPNSTDQLDFHANAPGVAHTAYPFAETLFEQSPLNRVLDQGAPGDAWQLNSSSSPNKGHISRYYYDEVRKDALYTAHISLLNGDRLLSRSSNSAMYSQDALDRVSIRDENYNYWGGNYLDRMTTESTDRDGKVVMRRKFSMNGGVLDTLSTYYVYDDLGLLCFVLPPAANPDLKVAMTQATLDKYCYQYKYDGKQRMTAKKLPGKGWEFMVYNKLDQLIMTQDSVQRGKSPQEWTVNKYDAHGRVVLTGIHTRAGTANVKYLNDVQTEANLVANQWETRVTTGNGYTSATYPTTVGTVLSVNYYDDYAIPGLPADAAYNQSGFFTKMTRGLATASKVNILGTSHYLWSVSYYDDEGRVVRGVSQHYKGGVLASNNYDESSNTYSFAGELTTSVRKHYVGGTESLYIKNDYVYDARGRKIDSYQTTGSTSTTVANAPVLLSRNEFNELGQLKRKRLHSVDAGASFKQDVAYTYNERGWLTSQSAPLFSQTLRYNETISGVTPQYNGNISRQEWGGSKYYNYRYDNLDRLTSAIASSGNNETIGYDLMGNIMRLQRKLNNSLIDQLKYTYSDGNKLSAVLDTNTNTADDRFQLAGTTNYTYDANGSMTSRINGVNGGNNLTGITYNLLNLPSSMTFAASTVTYTYNASGSKLRKAFGSNVNNDYIGGIHYESGVFASALTEVGRVVKNGTGTDPLYSYEYTLSDHLGNGRVYFDIFSGAARKIQETDYYAFGLGINIGSVLGIENRYQYNGKEKQDQEKMFDYGARFYDPVIGRFNVIDRFAEKYYTITSYQYGGNNPISTIDINGDSLWVTHRTGFLGLGGKETLRYEGGNYYNKDGSAYEGKVNGFLKQTSSALSDLSQTGEGSSLVSSLVGSDNNFTIVKGTNSFSASNVVAAGANLTEYQAATGNTRGSTGSGGIISFDPSTTTSSMNTAGNTNRPSYIGLGHEMAHGRDANFGVLHFSNDYTSGTGVTYQSQFMGLKKSEWRAAYYENLIRGQAGVPLRTHYGLSNDVNTGTSQGLGPRLLDVNNRPINYYK